MKERKAVKTVKGKAARDGAGVNLLRVLSLGTVKDFDPFLLLDFFDSENPADYINGFPWHPHRGIETVTYLIDGEIDHGDSLGNSGKIMPGCCQWMTAGSGIIHQEMPQASPKMLGLQLWINLPQKDKMTKPAYRDIKASMVTPVKEKDAEIRIISGEYKGKNGPFNGDYVKTTYLDVSLNADAVWEIDTENEDTVFAFIMKGSASFGGSDIIAAKTAVLFSEGGKLKARGGNKGGRFIFLSGKALKEPVAWGGPIVMNSDEELDKAFAELQKGTFIKEKNPGFEI